MKYPNKLLNNDLIEIIAPSNGITDNKIIKKLELAENYLCSNGFKVIEDNNVRTSVNGVSACPKKRADEFNSAINNKSVKALIACSGGDFLIQMLDYVNFSDFKDNIKWIQGQSDITSLLYYITINLDIATIYSFNVKTFGDKFVPREMLETNINFLKNNFTKQKEYGYRIDDKKNWINWKCISEFKTIRGRIIGGCLESLKDLIGTKYDCTEKFINKYKKDGIVWYFDIAEMSNEDILRTMWQLKHLNWFKYCTGIIVGRLYKEISYTGITFEYAISYYFKELNIPILINADIGHTNPVITIVNGSIVEINSNDNSRFEVETIFE